MSSLMYVSNTAVTNGKRANAVIVVRILLDFKSDLPKLHWAILGLTKPSHLKCRS